MAEKTFTRALGSAGHVRFYDPIIALTREKRWRGPVVEQLAPCEDDVIVDVGCGTGTLALMLRRRAPRARIVGVDPDPEVLALAQRKADAAGTTIDWRTAMGDALTEELGEGVATKVTSSLVLHQCPVPMKAAILRSMHALLRPGGLLVIADFGLQRTALMRMMFRIVQLADGKADTQPNADGVLPTMMSEAGFVDVRETEVVPTVNGSISIYVANRPRAPRP